METMVLCDDAKPFSRAYAWFRFVKIWSGMRFDDIRGTPNRATKLTPGGNYPQVQDLRPRQTYLALAFLREQGGMGEPVQLGGGRVEDLDLHGGGHVDPRFYVAMAVG